MTKIPQAVNRFNMYKKSEKLIGITSEVELPSVTQLTDEMEGAGTGGKMEVVIIGLTENMEMKIPFMSLSKDMFSMANPNDSPDLTLRGSIQGMDPATGKVVYTSMAIYVRGTVKELVPGKAKAKMESSITLTLNYYKITLDGETAIEIDKLNGVYIVNGEDVLKEVRDMC